MITNSRQNWAVDSIVNVGFVTLRVRFLCETPNDGKPQAYILTNLAGNRLYKFVPHNGLKEISTTEARNMIENHRVYKTVVEKSRDAHKADVAAVNAVFA